MLHRQILFGLLALGALLAVRSDQPPASPPVVEGPPGTVPSVYFGMHVHRLLESTPWPNVPFGAIRLWDTGTTWKDLEPQKNDWHFDRLDRLVNLAAEHHVRVLLCFGKTPAWASSVHGANDQDERVQTAPPANLEDWRHFVEKVATHYKGRIEAYEVWNEPNWHGFYTGDVHTMVEMTRIASETIHAVDSDALVVSPSATTFDGLEWFESFLEQGGARYVNVIGYHFYVTPDVPEQIPVLAAEVRSRMARNHVNLPLWDTETGWSKPKLFSSADESSAFVARSLLLAWSAGVSRFYWYAWDNRNWVTLDLTTGDDYRITPAAVAYQVMQNWMTGARVERCTRDHAGVWTCRLNKDGEISLIVWKPTGESQFHLPPAPSANGAWLLTDLHGNSSQPRSDLDHLDLQPRLLRWVSR